MTIRFPDDTLFFDIESHSADERYAMNPEEFFMIGGYSWGESDEVTLTTDYREMIRVIRSAGMIVGHNIHAFDLSVLFGKESIEPVDMARQERVLDTASHAHLANPAPFGSYTNRNGSVMKCTDPPHFKKWYSLDNQAFQLGVEGKSMDLKAFSKQFTYREEPVYSEKTGKLLKRTKRVPVEGYCCSFSLIPIDNEEFREYLEQDVLCTREVARALLGRHEFNQYARRYQLTCAIDAQISRNGIRLHQEKAMKRVVDMAEVTAHTLNDLHDKFGMPLSGKKPLTTKAGKDALLLALKSVGVNERDLGRTGTGALSFSGDSVRAATGWVKEDDKWVPSPDGRSDALALGDAVAVLSGQRSLAELALSSVHPDGYAHPSILSLQRSGRRSTTDPGLTIWDNSHKDYWIADDDDHWLLELDLANADQRVVAAASGDKEFAKRFEPGADGHLINAWAAWGKETVGIDKKDPTTAWYRQRAKAPGHGWGYRIGVKKCAATTGLTEKEAKHFLTSLNKAFPGVVRWQDRMSHLGAAQGYIENDWGRRMPIQKDRAYTQAPAYIGQSGTNEILNDGLIKLPNRLLRMIRIGVHDAIVACIPKKTFERDRDLIVKCLTRRWKPRYGGQEIEFPVTYGNPATNWKDAGH